MTASDVVEAKCGAQIYVVLVDAATGQLVQQGLEDAFLQIGLIDGRKFEAEGAREEAIEDCLLLLNKQGQPLLAHGRSGTYTDDKRIVIPMIHGQAILPDLKITDSSEALLTGRAPPFRLVVRGVRRTGEAIPGMVPALSEPFVVATARVKGAAKLEIPHLEDHVSKIECVGVQTQKKLEDIRAAAAAANVPDLHLPVNSVTKVGQFRELVEMAERSKPLRETLKQVLRLTKGWDVARDHVRRAVDTDVQLRSYSPDGRADVGLVFKCGAFNVIDINHPIGLLRRKQNPQQPNQELVDIVWLPRDVASCPDAVRKLLPQASTAWWNEGHPGWAFLPLTAAHAPPYTESGQPSSPTSSFTFTIKPGPATDGRCPPPRAPSAAPPHNLVPLPPPVPGPPSTGAASGVFGGLPAVGPSGPLALGFLQQAQQQQQQQAALNPPPAQLALGNGMVPMANLGGLGALSSQQGAAAGLCLQDAGVAAPLAGPPLDGTGAGVLNGRPLASLGGQFMAGPSVAAPSSMFGATATAAGPPAPAPGGVMGAAAAAGAGSSAAAPGVAFGARAAPAGAAAGGGAGPAAGVAGLSGLPGSQGPRPLDGAQQMQGLPSLDLFGSQGGLSAPSDSTPRLPKQDSSSPFEDPAFQNLMAMVAASNPQQAGPPAGPAGAGVGEGGAMAARGGQQDGKSKRKAETSLDNWVAMHKSLELDISLPPNLAQLSSLFTSLLAGNEMTPEMLRELLPGQQPHQQSPSGALELRQRQLQHQQHQPIPHQQQQQQQQQFVQRPQQQQDQEQEQLAGLPAGHPVGNGSVPAMPAAAGSGGTGPGLGVPGVPPPAAPWGGPGQGATTAPALAPPTALGSTAQPQPQHLQHVKQEPHPPAAAAPAAPPDNPAAAALASVSLEQLQQMFQAAATQQITYTELEGFLRQHNLLPAAQQAQQQGHAAPQQVQMGQQQQAPVLTASQYQLQQGTSAEV
ncbi:hypothetical protein N2152v2_003157 [Parachlorella kessleri]